MGMRLDLIYFDAGGGHRAAALALQEAIQRAHKPWQMRLFQLQEALDPLDPVRRLTGMRLQDGYNAMLRRGWTLGAAGLLPVLHAVIHARRQAAVRLIAEGWRRDPPDLAVSLVPHFNRALREALGLVSARAPLVTLITDLADYPPHFWIDPPGPGAPQYFICGTERAQSQAWAAGHHAGRVFRTSGMILHPRFYDAAEVDRRAERRRLGLDPERITGLAMFGGQGSRSMLHIAERLDRSGLDVQMIFVCGHNDQLAAALRHRRYRMSVFVEGFTTNVPCYMRLADFFLGKPGPASIGEALLMGLPVIVERNAWTLPQERYNADWIRERKVGLVVRSFRRVEGAVRDLLAPGAFGEFRAQVAAQNNRAVFEAPEILETILTHAAAQPPDRCV
jgi:1,2-diacylglycerol 3-beta-galactosyltransferase